MAAAEHGESGRTVADKLNYLFATVHPASRGPFSNAEVAREICAAGGDTTISSSTIAQLRSGAKANPTMKTIEALSAFFGVPPAYFFDDAVARHTDAEIAEVIALRDVKEVAMRANGLSEGSLKMIKAVIEQARFLEGLDPDPAPTEAGGA
ncbi:helix-turn-helix transcriptional regulator [Yinghuangia sp. ASG 101]|uniref:helix-turn-helix domain-containing protein n=1 Tax=Yinghuangia sp. ASG 101 TaxID=2896848 RepID=UPI001E505E3A|nr:helix-turn-helix transcriptional regulator [Yinghuangia sp. ASG 101]UGQ10971.1 helix-turn-helix transcriptional regulator [Yinghuangia sp. ASG 101]